MTDKNKHESQLWNASIETPMRSDAFDMSDDDKIAKNIGHLMIMCSVYLLILPAVD